jgi:tRNA dimethylallyltransferase
MTMKGETADRPEPLLVVLLGPTASGKTALSLRMAETFSGEIVSCDSVAVYRGMDIGSAKPSASERSRAPHHLLDVASLDAPYTAGDYSRDARAAIADIAARGRLPIVTGGTGLYLRALLDGLFTGPQRSEPLRARLRAAAHRHGSGWLHRLLLRLDRLSAERIHAHDEPKIIRAIEVAIATRQPFSSAIDGPGGRNPLAGYRILRIGLQPERAALYERINERAEAMFRAGLLEETRALLAAYRPRPAALGALGYRQAAQVMAGEISLTDAVAAAQQGHRNYAKRQVTWFRREPDVQWLEGFGDDAEIMQQACEAVSAALSREQMQGCHSTNK